MYNSPVTLYEDMAAHFIEMQENAIMAKIHAYVDVDKEELLKALDYDRKQYEAGYHDGLIEGRKKALEEISNIIYGMGNN